MTQRQRALAALAGACLACAAGSGGRGTPASAPARAAEAPAATGASTPTREALVQRARERVARREFADAAKDLDAALALQESADVLTLRGRTLGLDRRFDAATRDLERALELDAKSVEAWVILAAVQVNRGDQLEAERAFASAVALAGKVVAVDRFWTQLLAMPPDPIAPQETLDRCTRGTAAAMEREWLEAERELRSGLRYAPRYGWCLAEWAESIGRAGDFARAERIFRDAITAFTDAQRPLRADAEGRLAALLVSARKNGPEAVKLARGALEVRGDRGALLFVLGRACDQVADAACARDAYARMLRLPHVPDALAAAARERVQALEVQPSAAR